jgi:hypothetical protein
MLLSPFSFSLQWHLPDVAVAGILHLGAGIIGSLGRRGGGEGVFNKPEAYTNILKQ